MNSSLSSQTSDQMEQVTQEEVTIPSSLKFIVSNLKNIVPIPLSADNYSIWRSQIIKLLRANRFEKFLDPLFSPPNQFLTKADGSTAPNVLYNQWILTDQNLAAAICSTIFASILPYIVNLESTSTIWHTLEVRFPSSNRSRVIQLKNDLHHISMKTAMTQYLSDIKSLVDQIAYAGSSIDTEDIILYILNGLPASFQAFKTAIRTMITPISLDQLYPLLLSEEINIAAENARSSVPSDPTLALYTQRGRDKRTRGRNYNRGSSSSRTAPDQTSICQICNKRGHSTSSCWHRLNVYVPQTTNTNNRAMVAASDSATNNNWFLDSGASAHLTNSLDNLSIASPYQGSDSITIGDGRSMSIANSGTGSLPIPARKLTLDQILHIPELKYNLLSISKLTRDNNISITFEPNGFCLKDIKTQETLLRGPCRDGLYPVQHVQHRSPTTALTAASTTMDIWHNRLGHPHFRTLTRIANCNPELKILTHQFFCTKCVLAKSHKLVFDNSVNRRSDILDLVHSDVWGPSPVVSNQGYKYYVIFVDDHSRFTWLYPLMQKSDVANTFIQFKKYIEKLTVKSIKCLRTDGGLEYNNQYLTDFLKNNGISHQMSCPYTPEQNGTSERKHRHILETTRSLLITASVPTHYWPDAMITATYLINRMPSPATNNISPFESIFHYKPEYKHLKTFGCECYPLLPSQLRNKLQPKSQSCVFLGYSETYKGYKCLNTQSNKIFMSRHTMFNEHRFPFSSQHSSSASTDESSSPFLLQPVSAGQPSTTTTAHQNNSSQDTSQCNTFTSLPTSYSNPRSLPTAATPPSSNNTVNDIPCHHMITRKQTGSLKPKIQMNLIHAQQSPQLEVTPHTYTEAAKHVQWRQAMASEFFALQQQGTWTLTPLPPNTSILGCKWTFRIKHHADGSVARYKSRLVAQDNHQEHGIDYNETFSPVAKLPTIRILLTIALYNNWPVQQLDVANAFLHGDLSETIYIEQPKGFEDSSNPNHVCRLNKAIYGLKQAPRQWYNTFTTHLISLGFTHSKSDPSLLIYNQSQVSMFLLIYVDDILITGNNQDAIAKLLEQLNTKFSMKNLGIASSFLGIQIHTSPARYFLSQTPYAMSIIQQAHMQNCKSLANPNCTKAPTEQPADEFLSDPVIYRRITCSLQYLTLTRPDISYTINLLSQLCTLRFRPMLPCSKDFYDTLKGQPPMESRSPGVHLFFDRSPTLTGQGILCLENDFRLLLVLGRDSHFLDC
ncbi:Retrovirus-related Pol polyprotein from transposon TNT 1-94 [Dendrobium catenatum]|uniref:Retrovirus-related Pol polyprotein from transposon TNT 1-94 n=1 Tax=Dendrobium catenatum TaxID=906689 RepID=A0A2I0VFZ4_9ASPA|nr:Retrovirus-related Pol polyprotein from transposon TNT 1-94 [Dendrobium catenatum]